MAVVVADVVSSNLSCRLFFNACCKELKILIRKFLRSLFNVGLQMVYRYNGILESIRISYKKSSLCQACWLLEKPRRGRGGETSGGQ